MISDCIFGAMRSPHEARYKYVNKRGLSNEDRLLRFSYHSPADVNRNCDTLSSSLKQSGDLSPRTPLLEPNLGGARILPVAERQTEPRTNAMK